MKILTDRMALARQFIILTRSRFSEAWTVQHSNQDFNEEVFERTVHNIANLIRPRMLEEAPEVLQCSVGGNGIFSLTGSGREAEESVIRAFPLNNTGSTFLFSHLDS